MLIKVRTITGNSYIMTVNDDITQFLPQEKHTYFMESRYNEQAKKELQAHNEIIIQESAIESIEILDGTEYSIV